MARPIVTFTGNLLWEQTLFFDRWEPGRTQRAREASFQVGGKGINVSRMLRRLGVAHEAICFPGGATGEDCLQWMRSKGLNARPFPQARPTRTGTVVHSPHQPQTTFFSPDVPITAEALAACAEFLRELPEPSVLAICGSVPFWETQDYGPLKDLLAHWTNRHVLVVDAYGPVLHELVDARPTLVKVNRDEFIGLFPASDRDRSTRELLVQAQTKWSVRNWVVSDGPRPVWIAAEGSPPASIAPPAIREVSAVGSGDVLLAVLLEAWQIRKVPLLQSVAFALPYAAANAESPGVAEFSHPGLIS